MAFENLSLYLPLHLRTILCSYSKLNTQIIIRDYYSDENSPRKVGTIKLHLVTKSLTIKMYVTTKY